LLVSELVTNAVKAAQVMEEKPSVWLRLSASKTRLLIEVWDGNTQPPKPQELEDGLPACDSESGRGLFLVATLSTHWNWYLTQQPAGKVIWCELDTGELPEQERDAPVKQELSQTGTVLRVAADHPSGG
jgi:anti-sigma regulatory factor (Ser/Thr protein kinase)